MTYLAGVSSLNSYGAVQYLGQITPYLSSQALLAISQHTGFTASQKQSILNANPEGLRNSALLNSVENGGWFNSQQIAAIKTASQNTTARTQLEDDLREAEAALQGITQALENYYQLDEADNGLDYANQADWAANGESLDGYLRSIDNRLWAGDITSANSELSSLQAMAMSTAQAQEVNHFVQLKNIEIGLLNSNRSYDEATSMEISSLQTIASQSESRAGIQAQNWLHLLGISETQAEAYWGSAGPGAGAGSALIGEDENPTAQQGRQPFAQSTYLSVQPNPSANNFRFHYAPQSLQEESTLRIYSLSGQLLQQSKILSGSYFNWQPDKEVGGFYFFILLGENGDILQQGKLIYLPK